MRVEFAIAGVPRYCFVRGPNAHSFLPHRLDQIHAADFTSAVLYHRPERRLQIAVFNTTELASVDIYLALPTVNLLQDDHEGTQQSDRTV